MIKKSLLKTLETQASSCGRQLFVVSQLFVKQTYFKTPTHTSVGTHHSYFYGLTNRRSSSHIRKTVQHVGSLHWRLTCGNNSLPHNKTPDMCQYQELSRDKQPMCPNLVAFGCSLLSRFWLTLTLKWHTGLICKHCDSLRKSRLLDWQAARRKFKDGPGQRESPLQGGEDFLDSLGELQWKQL